MDKIEDSALKMINEYGYIFGVSLIFTLCTLIGNYYNDYIDAFWRGGTLVSTLFFFCFFYICYCVGLYILLHFFKRTKLKNNMNSKVIIILIAVIWLVNIVLCYPGSVPFDGFFMLDQFFGIYPKTNNHPYLVTLIQGLLMAAGRKLVDDNFGIFLMIVLQSVSMFFCIILTTIKLKKWGVLREHINIVLLMFLACPIFTIFTQYYRKDVVFSSLVFLYCIEFADSIICSEDCYSKKRNCFLIIIFGSLASLYRHNGIFIVVFSLLLRGLYFKRKYLFKNLIPLASVITIYSVMSMVVYPAMGAKTVTGDRTYGYSNAVRFQQTARYALKHWDEISDEEKTVINGVLEFEALADYDPYSADHIYDLYIGSTQEQKKAYDKLWIEQFKKDPKVYLGAFFEYTHLYMYPFENVENSVYKISDGWANTGYFSIARSDFGLKAVNILQSIYDEMTKFVFIRPLYSPALYFWIILVCCAYELKKRNWKVLLIFTPVLINMVICILGFLPVNGSIHYAFPIILICPFIVGITIWDYFYTNKKL